MKRNRLAVVAALLVVVALGLAAATLANPTTTGGGGSGVGAGGGGDTSGPGSGGSTESPGSVRPGGAAALPRLSVCVTFLQTPAFFIGALVAMLVLGAVLRWRTNTVVAIAVLVVLAIPSVLIYSLLTSCRVPPPQPKDGFLSPIDISNRTLPVREGMAGGAKAAVDVVTTPPVILFAFLGLVVAVAVIALRGSGDDREIDEFSETDSEEVSLDAVADAAGTAADRIDASGENAIYRAWTDMTAQLDIESPRTTTPAEFAQAARDAGMDAEHVDTLTAVFREVRYGDEPVTDERERRARDALRDIEAAYGGEEE